MKLLPSILAILLLGCGGTTPKTDKAAATIEAGEAKDCAGACDRFAQCWQKQYGQQDVTADRAECESRCTKKSEPEQRGYIARTATETSCVKILNDL